MIYQWKPERQIKIDAQSAGKIFERLEAEHDGRLTPAMIVTEAQPKTSPLHDHFEWNDHRAAKAYRLDQAALLVRSIEVVHLDGGNENSRPIRAFVSVVKDEGRCYTSTVHAFSDEDLRQQVLEQALSDLEAWRQRYAELAELAEVFGAIDEARAARKGPKPGK